MSEGAVVVEMSSKMSEVGDEEKQAKSKMTRRFFNQREAEKEKSREEMSDEEKRRKAERLMRRSARIRRVVIVLAALEQAATYLAQIAFLGATVVLLGGYATRLKLYDFVLISALLLSEGVRVFLASLNAEYTRAIGGEIAGNWGPGIFVGPWLIRLGYYKMEKQDLIISIFQVLQMASAAVTFAFSLTRLKSGNYKPTLSSPSDAGEVANFVYGIRLFYILTLVESAVFMVIKAVAWELLALLLSVGKRENGVILLVFALKIYGVFLSEGFGKASATNFFTFIINFILENQNDAWAKGGLEVLRWQIPDEARTSESIKCLIRLTAPGQPEQTRRCANQILASVALRGESAEGLEEIRPCANQHLASVVLRGEGMKNFLLAVPEFGRIPLEVVDIDVINFLRRIVRDAPSGFLPVEAVSKQASKFLIRSILVRDGHIKALAAYTFLQWWSIPRVYREYGFDPADIFYRLYTEVRVGKGLDFSNFEAEFEYEEIAEPIRTVFSQAVFRVAAAAMSRCDSDIMNKFLSRVDIMNKLLSSVDFSKLKNKQSTINLSGIVAEVIGAESELDDEVVGLVAAWIWFMDESTFEKAISNLTKEELGMLKENTIIYSAILSSKNDLGMLLI